MNNDADGLEESDQSSVAVAVKPKSKAKVKRKQQPRYSVLLWDDNDHSYEYVIQMMQVLFGHSMEKSVRAAVEVDTTGRCVCLTTTMEHAELKRDQIESFGRDVFISRCQGAMHSTIEPIE